MFFAFHCLGLCVPVLKKYVKKKMFPKYLTPGKKNFLNQLVLTEMEENFQNEDRQHTVLTPVKLSCTFPRRQVASACSGRQDH